MNVWKHTCERLKHTCERLKHTCERLEATEMKGIIYSNGYASFTTNMIRLNNILPSNLDYRSDLTLTCERVMLLRHIFNK